MPGAGVIFLHYELLEKRSGRREDARRLVGLIIRKCHVIYSRLSTGGIFASNSLHRATMASSLRSTAMRACRSPVYAFTSFRGLVTLSARSRGESSCFSFLVIPPIIVVR